MVEQRQLEIHNQIIDEQLYIKRYKYSTHGPQTHIEWDSYLNYGPTIYIQLISSRAVSGTTNLLLN